MHLFGLMFLSPKNAKLVVVHTNLRGDSLAMVYYTELPRENSLSPAERVETKDLPSRYRDVCACAQTVTVSGRCAVLCYGF